MKKRIVICADGTWNRPERDLKNDIPTNVLRLARAIRPTAPGGIAQHVFYDWGLGSYHDRISAGATGKGLNKNIMDDYRYIVQNYSPGDEIFVFGFSRGAYTVRSLCGLINNVGILKRPDARLIEAAFEHYKKSGKAYHPDGKQSVAFRQKHSHPSRTVTFAGVWDTVGALGIPIVFLGFLDPEDEFYDTKIGPNVKTARHAMAIDERRVDFEPTVWIPQKDMDIKQVWFCGVHSDVGGGYKADRGGHLLSDFPLQWMMREAAAAGLALESHLQASLKPKATATAHRSRKGFYRAKKSFLREIDHAKGKVLVHASVKERWKKDGDYRPPNLKEYLQARGGWPGVTLES